MPDALDESTADLPPVLYHYTSTTGILGILKSGSLWATDIRFLNDERELDYGVDLAMPILTEKLARLGFSGLGQGFLNAFPDPTGTNRHFVACFCEEGDLLSQWRGYASPGGYAIGLDASEIVTASSMKMFQRVWYDIAEVGNLMEEWACLTTDGFVAVFGDSLREYEDGKAASNFAPSWGEMLYNFEARFFARLEYCCSLVKHPSFEEEREWRVLRSRSSSRNEVSKISFREGSLGLTPYAVLDFSNDKGLVPLKEIIVGPGRNMDLRIRSVSLLLEELGYGSDVRVIASKIPFRP